MKTTIIIAAYAALWGVVLAIIVVNRIHTGEEAAQLYILNGNKITVKAGEDVNCFRGEVTHYDRWCPVSRRVYCPFDEKTMILDCSKAIMP